MKEMIHTIPVNEAFEAQDECPFCYLERQAEQSAIRYVAGNGASYMEPDVRAATDRKGFCGVHMKKLYDYGNALGNALILQTHMAGLIEDFQYQRENFQAPAKKSLFGRKKAQVTEEEPYWKKLQETVCSCYICDKIDYNTQRYLATFFILLREPEFRAKVENSKGFCLRHFAQLLEMAEQELQNAHHEWFYKTVFDLMEDHLIRVKEDLDWFVAKHDYRNASAPWKNSQDAVPRTMQKLEGIYPADPVYRHDR